MKWFATSFKLAGAVQFTKSKEKKRKKKKKTGNTHLEQM
jgi:hypothetical protein